MSKTSRSIKSNKNHSTKKRNNKSRSVGSRAPKRTSLSKWFAYGVVTMIAVTGIIFIYRSYAVARPNLRFQVLKNNTCVSSVPSTDSVVHVRIYRTEGSETINNIVVKVNGQPVSTNPTSISGPTTNLMIASPSLSAVSNTMTVTGTKSGAAVEFSPYCEANGNTNRTISVVSTSTGNPGSGGNTGGNTGSTPNQRLSSLLSTNDLANGYLSSSAETAGPAYGIYGERPGIVTCIQGRCSYNFYGTDPGTRLSTLIRPQWGCTNGSGWAYKVLTGPKAGRWLCTNDYSTETDPVIRPWLRVLACEASGNWYINTGNGFYGGLQFDLQTWRSVGGQGYPHQNSPHEQAYRAEILRTQRGTQPWPICGRYYNG